MKLSINTANNEQILITINGVSYETSAKKDKSQKLLPFISETLASLGLSLEDITEIEVDPGPGSFTGLRVGVTVAQTLGYMLGVPVNGEMMDTAHFVKINY